MDEEVRWTKTTIEIHFVQVENQNVIFFLINYIILWSLCSILKKMG